MDRGHCCGGVGMLPPLESQSLSPPLFPEERQDLPHTIRGIILLLERFIRFIFSHLYEELFSYFSCCCIYFNILEEFDKYVVTLMSTPAGQVTTTCSIYFVYQKTEAKLSGLPKATEQC